MSLRLPIGYDIFGELIEKQFDFVDKSLLAKEVLDDSAKVIVITRPRRFGKTLNLSMLHYFFSPVVFATQTSGMFDHLRIASLGEPYMRHQGQYPVIFVTLKDLSNQNFPHVCEQLRHLLARVYKEYRYLQDSPHLSTDDKQFFADILGLRASVENMTSALRNLIDYLYQHHQQKVWLLVDEYDTPLQSAYLHGYYDEMVSLMRGMLGSALKTSPYLEKAVITGILRVAKESIFSGLNNLQVYTLLDNAYSEYFGFTESEVVDLFHRADLDHDMKQTRNWYNGYLCGDTVIYNPWSVVNCLKYNGALEPYWVNTSSNDLVKKLFAQGDDALKNKLEILLTGKPIAATVSPGMVFGDLLNDQNAVWSLLLFSGYLKAIASVREKNHLLCQLMLPNYEVSILFEDMIQSWLTKSLGYDNYHRLLNSLLRGDIEEFRPRFEDCLALTFSIFDVTGQHPEKFYHGFVLGLMVSLADRYEIKSNAESGYGRADVMLIPKDNTQLGIVLEFKTIRDKEVDLLAGAQQALQQIQERRYADILQAQGVNHIMHLGLAFRGKDVAMQEQMN